MTTEEFRNVLEKRIKMTRDMLDRKASEYARQGDRLSNFKRAAAMLQCIPEKACIGAWSKHVISILDMMDDMGKGVLWRTHIWEEKIGDAINYLILLEALIKERAAKGEETESHGMEEL